MGRILGSLAFALVCAFGGWLAGSIYPAPASVVGALKPQTDKALARAEQLDFSVEGLKKLRERLTPEQFTRLRDDAVKLATSSGSAVAVERVDPADLQAEAEAQAQTYLASVTPSAPPASAKGAATKAPTPAAGTKVAAGGPFLDQLKTCPRMTISNGPRVGADGVVQGYAKFVSVNGVKLATYPAPGACLSSGFGARNGRLHKGVDYYSPDGGPIFAAGDGRIVELKYRDDFGNMIVIDHGGGVFTRYAHLSSFERGLAEGATVKAGQPLGLMGNTAAYRIPIHLHYELLMGDINTQKGSFGLEPKAIFTYPAAG